MATLSGTSTFITPRPMARVQDAPLVLEDLRSLAAVQDVAPAWERLMVACPTATPFQSAEWLLPWAQTFGAGGLLTLAAWRGPQLVGLAPLRHEQGPQGRTLAFLGRGITDYSGFLIDPGQAGAGVAEAFLARLQQLRSQWDQCELDGLLPSDPAFAAPLPDGLIEERTHQDPCPSVPLPAGPLERALAHGMGLRATRYLRRLRREANVTFELATSNTVDELMEAFFTLHGARWQRRGHPGVLADAHLQEFHRMAARGMLARGRLRLHALRMDGVVRAVIYGFMHGRRFYSYLSGFDPTLAHLSLGTVAVCRAMCHAADEGCEAFDFLRGAEPYKYRWGAIDRWTRRRLIREAPGDAGQAAQD